MLECRNIIKEFQTGKSRMRVLDNITLKVDKGEFVSIIGPSGCGKSTLFQLIGGLMTPDSGDIFLDGRNITGQSGHISYMPQHNTLFPWRTVEENAILALEIAGEPRRQALRTAREWLERLGLERYAKEYPHALSGGMQQRVAFLRALISPQELMCLDEPFGALDALTRHDMQQWLLDIWERHRRTVLFITHSIEEAILLSDRIYVLSNKPASVVREFAVPFARPRSERLLEEQQFVRLRTEIHGLLRIH
jgi:ABC-type nitrate/sulfonate/bicarbonate transport system ATPase subunit